MGTMPMERRHAAYLAIIQEAEERAANARDEEAAQSFRRVAEGYRALLKRQFPKAEG